MKRFRRLIAISMSILMFAGMTLTASAETVENENPVSTETNRRIQVRKVYSEVPHGNASDYTALISDTKNGTKIASFCAILTVDALTVGLSSVFGLNKIARQVARAIVDAGMGVQDNVYIWRREYGHKDDNWSYRKVITKIYSDSNYSTLIDSKVEYYTQYFY